MKKLIAITVLAASLTLGQAQIVLVDFLTGALSGANSVSPNGSTASGGEIGNGLRYDLGTQQLEVNVAYGLFGFQPLEGNYTASHIHQAPVGVNGPVVIPLAPIPDGTHAGTFNQTVLLTSALASALLAGDLYMNIHSDLFTGGEIRGQLVAVPEASAYGTIAGLGLLALGLVRRYGRFPGSTLTGRSAG